MHACTSFYFIFIYFTVSLHAIYTTMTKDDVQWIEFFPGKFAGTMPTIRNETRLLGISVRSFSAVNKLTAILFCLAYRWSCRRMIFCLLKLIRGIGGKFGHVRNTWFNRPNFVFSNHSWTLLSFYRTERTLVIGKRFFPPAVQWIFANILFPRW